MVNHLICEEQIKANLVKNPSASPDWTDFRSPILDLNPKDFKKSKSNFEILITY